MPLQVRGQLQESPQYLEKEVRFSFSRCDTGRFCVQELEKKELSRFYERLGYLEKHTWNQLRKIPRENAISIDKNGGRIFELLKPRLTTCSTFGHFRVNGTNVNIRIFVGIERDMAFILLVDREGALQH